MLGGYVVDRYREARLRQLGQWVKDTRERRGLTQVQAAEAAGVSRGTWIRLESGEQGTRETNYPLIAEALKVSVDEVYAAAMQPPAQGYTADDLGFPDMAVTVPKLTYTHGDSAPRNVLVEPTYEPSDDIAEIWAYYDGMPPEMQAEVKEDLRRKFLAAKARGVTGRKAE